MTGKQNLTVARGEIYNRERASQLNDFSGLRFGKITPTDVDGLIEFDDKLYIIFELKYKDNDMPNGQRLALTRLVDRLRKSGVPAYLLLASHAEEGDTVNAAQCNVTKYYNGRSWHKPRNKITLLAAVKHLHSLYIGTKQQRDVA